MNQNLKEKIIKMSDIKIKTKTEVILETAQFYNLTNRGINQNNSCVYKTEDGKMCAVARCLQEFPGINEDYSVEMLIDEYDLNLFKPEYQIDDTKFWSDLQGFHDNSANWTKEGLSEEGVTRLNYLLETYKND